MEIEKDNVFLFDCSNRVARVLTSMVIVFPLCVVFANQLSFIENPILYWIANIAMLIVIMRFADTLMMVIPFVKSKGICYVDSENLIMLVGRKMFVLSSKEIVGMDYFNARIYNNLMGGNWDRLTVKTPKISLHFMGSPNEESRNYEERQLFKLMKYIRKNINKEEPRS